MDDNFTDTGSDYLIERRTEEEAKELFSLVEPSYIVLNKKVHKDIKGNEELDITLFDLSSNSEQGAILSISAKDYKTTNRVAQSHEIDRAKKLLEDYRESIWSEDLNS